MSLTTEKAAGSVRAAESDSIVNYWPAYWTMICLFVFYVTIRIYEQYFGWKAGLDFSLRSSRPIGSI